MTIITKALSGEKKGDKLVIPLVDNDELATAPPNTDVEAQNPNILILRARVRRVSTTTTLCLILTSLIVVSVGIFGGKYLYSQYISAQMRKFTVNLPVANEYQDLNEAMPDTGFYKAEINNDLIDADRISRDDFDKIMQSYFRENVELDIAQEKYEKIDVPDFRGARSGRFIHDFSTNTTAIIDLTGKRCFVMPLNRTNILPPRNMYDLIEKMWGGYYKVNTETVRQSMVVITPPLKSLTNIGPYIASECKGKPVYQLVKYVEGVVKRSTDNQDDAAFIEFGGYKLTRIRIVNFNDVEESEKNGIY